MNNDWDFVTRLSYYGEISNLNTVEVKVRQYADNVSAAQTVIENEQSLSVLLRKKLIEKKLNILASQKEIITHCTAHPAPYWSFSEQEFVWVYQEEYLSLLYSWLYRLMQANSITKQFNQSILREILFDEIYLNIENKFTNMTKPEKFKMTWLP